MVLSGRFLYIFLITSVIAKNELYMGNKLYRVTFDSQVQQDKLRLLKNDVVDFWRNPSFEYGINGLAMVPPSEVGWFEERLQELGVEKTVVINDVYDYLKEREETMLRTITVPDTRTFTFDAFYLYDEILAHLQNLTETFNTTMTLEHAGYTEQNRELTYVKISTTNFEGTKPVVVIEAGIIAREWITIPAAINVIHQLHETENSHLLENLDWIIVPVVNPDGYEFSHENNRFWEKNRSLRSGHGIICPGANINRNFDIAWSAEGGSTSPCSNLFSGIEPFSEEESQMLRDIFLEYQNRMDLYISIRNEGSFISYPWSYEQAASGMFRRHHMLGLSIFQQMNVTNPILNVGSIVSGSRASGTSADFMQDNNILYSFNFGIAQDDDGGVVIHEDDIERLIEPVWTAIALAGEFFISG